VRYRILATDYDGTLACDGVTDEQTVLALEQFRDAGGRLILVTGRELPDLERAFDRLDVFERIPLWRYTINTTLIAVLSTVGVVVSCVPVAYALSRMQWRGRQASFILVLATLMLPFQVTVIPLSVVFVRLGWINTLAPLIVPSFFGDAFSIFLLRQFFLTIPEEMSDAARVDGGSEWQIMTRVIVPLAKPAIAAVALFSFLYNWNDFFGPLLYVGGNSKLWTLGLGLSEFRTMHHAEWNLMMAASMLFMLPVIVLFFLAQRVFVEGVTLTGVKG